MAADAPVREVVDALAGAVLVRPVGTGGPLVDRLVDVLVALLPGGAENP